MAGNAPLLSPEAQARVAQAVVRAEASTTAEIVVMLSARSGAYRSLVLLVALLVALVAPWPLIAFTDWSAAAIVLTQAGAAAAILAAGLHGPTRLALVPAPLRRRRAREAARLAFRTRGLARTRGRTGVLLFLALAERHAEIVADVGVLARTGPEAWTAILADLSGALRRGEAEAGLVAAVAALGAQFAHDLPGPPGDPDELPNRLIVLG